MRTRVGVLSAALLMAAILLAGGCSSSSSPAASGTASGNTTGTTAITAIGAENEYANVIAQIGGLYVHAEAIMSSPDTDPNTFEASASVAREISQAKLVVQKGLGYDTWATRMENASPDPGRKVINVQQLLGLPASTPNPNPRGHTRQADPITSDSTTRAAGGPGTADLDNSPQAVPAAFYGRTAHAAGTGDSQADRYRQLAFCSAVAAAFGARVTAGFFDEDCRADDPPGRTGRRAGSCSPRCQDPAAPPE